MHSLQTKPDPAITWDALHASWRIQVFGAGGARGRELVMALLTAGHPPSRLTLYGRHARDLAWRGQRLSILPTPAAPPPSELAFLCVPPALAEALAERLAGTGTRVVDLGGGGRVRSGSSLVLSGVNDRGVGAFTEELTLPHPTTALIARPLAVLEAAAGLAEVDLFAVVSAACEGARGILALRTEMSAAAFRGGAPEARREARVGNLRPCSSLGADFEEQVARELRTLLESPELPLDVQAYAGDVERCDVFAVKVLLHAALAPEEACERFRADRDIHLLGNATPTPAACTRQATVQVGRIRSGSRGLRSLCFLAAGDQLVAGSSIAALRAASRFPAA